MQGNPANFDAIGNRLGFRIAENNIQTLRLIWHGPRFPAYLCLSIAVLLLFVSVPIIEAVRLRGFVGPAASLWYFPLMNLILFGIACYLLTLKRAIVFHHNQKTITLTSQSLFNRSRLSASYSEIEQINLGVDQVYNGFAVAGSSAAQQFPVPSLRLYLVNGETVLLDRGSRRRLKELGKQISERLKMPFEVDARLET
ncbi:MAG: hypothetical protein GEU77_04465 [Deltaproteobacteria bacterium]|nr:hypothetical protein [Deltaproteobacteria bacterium]